MAVMTNDEALNVLAKIAADRRNWEQQNVALKHAEDLFSAFKETSAVLQKLRQEKVVIEGSIKELNQHYEAEKRRLDDALSNYKKSITDKNEILTKEAEALATETHKATSALKQKQATVEKEMKKMDEDMATKKEQLEALTASFEAFKREHGLR